MRYVRAAAILEMMVLAAVLTAVAFSAPARAQFGGGEKVKTPLDLKYEHEERERKDNERAYNEQMKRLKAQGAASTSSDPWKGVRPNTDSSAKR
jgi:hypothetical protein